MTFPAYQGAQRCTGGPAPGASALLAWLLANRDGHSLGIYNCRTVRGGSTTSLHGEGRAVDWAVEMTNGRGSSVGHAIVEELRANAGELGVQCIIYDRTIWSARSPDGRSYTGVHPHYDHLHIELTREAADALTLAGLVEVLGGTTTRPEPTPVEPKAPSPSPTPAPTKSRDWFQEVIMSLGTIRRGSRGGHVRRLQHMLGLYRIHLTADGIFGPKTERAVVEFQEGQRIGVDGIVGPQTWTQLLVKARL